ncbi:MAG: hypothetical protein ACK52I_07835 [Pseudomonadota bacterium]
MVRADEHHRPRLAALQPLQHAEARALLQVQVGDHDVGREHRRARLDLAVARDVLEAVDRADRGAGARSAHRRARSQHRTPGYA